MDKLLLEKLFENHNDRPDTTSVEEDFRAMKPSKHVINNILNFSRALNVSPSSQIGHIAYLMN